MGRTSNKNKIRGSYTFPVSEYVNLNNKILNSKRPTIDEDGNVKWNANEETKNKYFPKLFNQEKIIVQNKALNIIENHKDKQYLTADDANNFIKSYLNKNGVYINGTDFDLPNPKLNKSDYALMSNVLNHTPLYSLMKVTPNDIYRFMYGMARGRERFYRKLEKINNGEKVPVTDYRGTDSKWMYDNRNSMSKNVIFQGNNQFTATILPSVPLSKQNNAERKSERMKIVVKDSKGKIINKGVNLPTFNSETTGAHSALIDRADVFLNEQGYV